MHHKELDRSYMGERVKSKISKAASMELVQATWERYTHSTKSEKGKILDEFVALTGLTRKRAIVVLRCAPKVAEKRMRKRNRLYNEGERQALLVLWEAADRVCGKRLKPLIPLLIQSLEEHGHLNLESALRERLLTVGSATIDRALKSARMDVCAKKRLRAKAKSKVRTKVPVRTFSDWNDPVPGFMEVDCVAHCGGTMAGSFIHSLVLTDLSSGWTECLPLVVRTGELVVDAISTVMRMLPFPLKGIDVDNGSEFINEGLLKFCTDNNIEFTRARPRRKNDQAWIEQKNGSVVRRLLGYMRYEGLPAAKAISRLYAASRLYVNFFQPSFKLDTKVRVGSRIKKNYHPPATPCQRLLASESIPDKARESLQLMAKGLDPIRLLEEIRTMQDHIARLAEGEKLPIPPHRDADLDTFIKSLATAWKCGEVRPTHQRPEKAQVRWWRTKDDPFEETWPTVQAWLEAEPHRTAKELFKRLQDLCPGIFPDNQLRTLQRRVRDWRCAEARRLLFVGRGSQANPMASEDES